MLIKVRVRSAHISRHLHPYKELSGTEKQRFPHNIEYIDLCLCQDYELSMMPWSELELRCNKSRIGVFLKADSR